MYKSKLPPNCPPSDAYEHTIELYRVFDPEDILNNFKNYVELYPYNESYKKQCAAYALSFFDNIERCEELLQKEINAGKKIAKVKLNENYGKLSKSKQGTGHYNFWAYETLDFSSITYEFI